MDPLAGFLDGPRARSAFVMRIVLEPPWSIRVQDDAPLSVTVVTHGSACLLPSEHEAPIALHGGDVLIIRAAEPYIVADRPATEPGIVIDPGGHCRTLDGRSLVQSMDLGVRTWGNAATGSDVMLVGTYQSAGEISRRLLDSLPRLVVLRAGDWDSPVVGLLAAEIVRDEPGQQVILDRLLDLLLISALRAAFATRKVSVPAWFSADADPTVGRVVRMMHDDPGRPWTVAELAAAVGVSRASLARRFHEVVGEPPMAFLTGWRMALAADLLLADDATVTSVARATGYGSPFTFSTAFKRTYGASPRSYRDRELAALRTESVARTSAPAGHRQLDG